MAKFFVSYSRSVKDDVQEVVAQLRSDGHEVWWDGDIPIMADWWATILTHIEWCEIFIFVVSNKSIKSPYCIEELKYAVERNRPVLPFIIEENINDELPAELPPRNQWLVYRDDFQRMLREITDAYHAINWEKYKDIWAPRPVEPNSGGISLTKQYQEARKLANDLQFKEAKKKFRDIKSLDYGEWGNECDEWITRINNYSTIIELVDHEYTLHRAYEAWVEYIQKYGIEFDPYGVQNKIKNLKNDQKKGGKQKSNSFSISISMIISGIAIIGILSILFFTIILNLYRPDSSDMIFSIVPERSEVRLTIGYNFYGTRTTMNARTNAMSGDIILDLNMPQNTSIGEISADASTLETDSSELEDIFLRMIILQSTSGEENQIIFRPTELLYLPSEPLNIGDRLIFQMIGNLTVQGVTNSTTVNVTVTILSETEIQGLATTQIAFEDFRITIPYIPEVEPEGEVTLEINFIASSE